MILHMLGGGPAQISAITGAKEKGLKVLVSDLDPSAPGFDHCNFRSFASTFDEEAVCIDGRKFHSSFLMTTGTDQPVLTAARVSKRLNLPYFLTPEQALIVTNKRAMKNAFLKAGIPTMPFTFLNEDFTDEQLKDLSFPLVIKPLDSQGQRGVLKVDSIDDIRRNFREVLSYSREEEILAEEYYPSDELTVNGWTEEGKAIVLMLTDRVTVDNGPHLGVCLSHRYPSLYHSREKELRALVQNISDMIGLKQGPLYFQILAGEKGFRVNEIACRLGGAYEDEFIPLMTGFPLLDNMIDMTRGSEYPKPDQITIDENLKGKYLSLQMFFSSPGTLFRQGGMEEVLSIEGILNGRFLLTPGTDIGERENSTQRAGYFIVTGQSPADINRRINKAYNMLTMDDIQGRPMMQFNKRMLFPL